MTTATETWLFSRPIRVDPYLRELQPGDLVDVTCLLEGDWRTLERVGQHDEDEDADRRCDGDCGVVLFFADDAGAFHVFGESSVFARFPVGGDR